MASKSDGAKKGKAVRYSRMKQPTLIEQLKGILTEYPDGGQILKELIQNAEDAGAREIKILHDKRNINNDTSESSPAFKKFFKSPALCVYNDAVFTDTDWEGIQMIYSSVKEKDPMKVGRFGLGFKSVFHMTDFPSVISGNTLLLVDPQQSDPEMVNGTLDLCALDDYTEEVIEADVFWNALEDTFGLCRDMLGPDGFQGTIFWFPLREDMSDLSDTLYNDTKVSDLFASFKSEASNMLIFLGNVQHISLHVREGDDPVTETLRVEKDDRNEKIKQNTDLLKEKGDNLESFFDGKDIHNAEQIVIRTSTADTCVNMKWLVVNYFVRNSASDNFRKLIKNKTLSYSPYVGIARPLDGNLEDFEGHVFCFLPLPREGERLTGLPVHVNGFFALSQNRHHMKWETDEQEGQVIDDKSILWNKALIEEALPKAYEMLILEAIKIAEKNGSEDGALAAVYSMMPLLDNCSSKTHKRWSTLEKKVYERLEMERILFATHTMEWIPIKEACFATFSSLSDNSAVQVQKAVTVCLHKIGLKYAKVPTPLFEILKTHYPYVADLTPNSLAAYLHANDRYKQLSTEHKINVLEYLLSDAENSQIMKGLELLPLASGQWAVFNKSSDAIYLCSEDEMKMFPGREIMFVMPTVKLGKKLNGCIESMCTSDMYQIEKLSTDCAKSLLKETVNMHIDQQPSLKLTKESKLNFLWLKNVWQVLTEKRVINHFKDIQIVPVLLKGTWSDPEDIRLTKLTAPLLLNAPGEFPLTSDLSTCLQALAVDVLPSLPEWIPVDGIQAFTYQLNYSSISSLLSKVNREHGNVAVTEFNRIIQTNSQTAEAFREFSSNLIHLESDTVALLGKLKMFKAVRSLEDDGFYTSVSDVPRYFTETAHFPVDVPLPLICIKVKTSEEMIIKQLGAETLSTEKLVLLTLQELLKNRDEVPAIMTKFMTFVLGNSNFIENPDICSFATKLRFVKAGQEMYTPSELFDPFEPLLQNLFISETLFPEPENLYGIKEIESLKLLGLKGKDDVDANTMLQVATTLDLLSRNNKNANDTGLSKKAVAFIEHLCNKPNLLQNCCRNSVSLGHAVMSLNCIPVKLDVPPDYPVGLPWCSKDSVVCKPSNAKVESLCLLVGATMPIVECATEEIIQYFKWNNDIEINNVFQQLLLVQKHYDIRYKPDFMRSLHKIYMYFSKHVNDLNNIRKIAANERAIWNSSGFEIPEKMIATSQDEDFELQPYLYTIPEEFRDMHVMFSALGCNRELDNALLIKTLKDIKISSETIPPSQSSVKRGKDIVLKVLTILANRKINDHCDIDEESMLMLTESGPDTLILRQVTDCIFDEDQDELDIGEEDDFHIVNSLVPAEVATALGVKSIKRKTINAATEDFSFKEWGQSEALTTRLKTLLIEGYKDGLSVPKELIQNADDAGATEIKFMFDERQNYDARSVKKLLSSNMCECQGPALWVFNNSVFEEKDMDNITKLNGATKAGCQDKIGKFGLGFCSVYNITDVPSFLSGQDMVIFDPHESYIDGARQKRGTGLRINLSKPNVIRRNIDQFKPYNYVFDCKILSRDFIGYQGTLFRLPLRTESQATRSEICNKAYNSENVISLLDMIIENAGNLLLFTQNVVKLQIFHLPSNAADPAQATLLYSIEKECVTSGQNDSVNGSTCILEKIPSALAANRSLIETHQVKFAILLPTSLRDMLGNIGENLKLISETWIITWASGTGESLQLSNVIPEKKAVPLAAVAMPVNSDVSPKELTGNQIGFYKEGYLFCFLPLPIKTGLPVNINGCFSVKSDRTDLLKLTEDDKSGDDIYLWNKVLMEDAVVLAYLHLLEYLTVTCETEFNVYSLWPLSGSDTVLPCISRFFQSLFVEKTKLFRGCMGWFSIDEIVILDPHVRNNTFVGDIAFDVLTVFPVKPEKHLVDLPSSILKALRNCEPQQSNTVSLMAETVVSEKEFILHFLNTLSNSYWDSNIENRNQLLLYTLNNMSEDIADVLKGLECIPSEPDQILRKPSELVDPKADIASMFLEDDGRFPLKSEGFNDAKTLEILIGLGMNRLFLPETILMERCLTLETLNVSCGICAQERFISVINYLAKHDVLRQLENDSETVEQLKNTKMLPVMSRPSNWLFKWKGDKCSLTQEFTGNCGKHSQDNGYILVLEKPVHLFREIHHQSIGSVALFVDEDFIQSECAWNENLYQTLSVQDSIPQSMLIDQLLTLPQEYRNAKEQFTCLEIVHKNVIRHLFELIQDDDEDDTAVFFNNLSDKKIVLIGQELIKPCNVAVDIVAECPPYMFCLPKSEKRREKLFRMFGVKDNFISNEVVEVLKQIKLGPDEKLCGRTDIICKLLNNLKESMEIEGKVYSDVQSMKDDIVAPDEHCILCPSYKLVIEDSSLRSKDGIHILHESIPLDLARFLGVQSKRERLVQRFSKLIPFGQKEMLSTRLKGLLQEYPLDSGIMKELLQNADDAKATTLHFIKDYRHHPTERIFGSDTLQGPALCIYNDSYFDEKDFEGIHFIGEGSKKNDPTKTGQYGVGFNAVYHITDVPSFLTRGPGLGKEGTLCLFDPLRKYLPEYVTVEEPGVRCDVEEMKKDFPDVLSGYLLEYDTLVSDTSTLFRLPLRTVKTDLSSDVISTGEIDRLLEEMKEDMFEMLLFVRNVCCVKVSRIEGEQLIEEYSVSTNLSPEDARKREDFFCAVNGTDTKIYVDSQEEEIRCSDLHRVSYTMTIQDSKGKRADWHVIQRFSKMQSLDVTKLLWELKKEEIFLLPLGGVAIPLLSQDDIKKRIMQKPQFKEEESKSYDSARRQIGRLETTDMSADSEIINNVETETDDDLVLGKIFCFLPLPGLTNLPIYINGHFALDRARRSLWEGGLRQDWNEVLLKNVVAVCWAEALVFMRSYIVGDIFTETISKCEIGYLLEIYHNYFPKEKASNHRYDSYLVKCFYETVVEQKMALFPVIMPQQDMKRRQKILSEQSNQFEAANSEFVLRWVNLATTEKKSGGIFNDIFGEINKSQCRYRFIKIGYEKSTNILGRTLKMTGLELIETPLRISRVLQSYGINTVTSTPTFVSDFLRSLNWDFGIGTDKNIEKTVFKKAFYVRLLHMYIFLDESASTLLPGLPICITNDGVLRKYCIENQVFISRYADILPEASHSFLHIELFDEVRAHSTDLIKAGIAKSFDVQNLIDLMSDMNTLKSLKGEIDVEWNKASETPVSEVFISRLFEFLVDQSQEKTQFGSTFTNYEKLQTQILALSDWTFLPSVRTNNTETRHKLIPICQAYRLFDCSGSYAELTDVIQQLNLPSLDKAVFKLKVQSSIITALDTFLASTRSPLAFLKCLHHCRRNIKESKLSSDDGIKLMSFFDSRIKDLQTPETMPLKNILMSLPLFPTIQRTLIDISERETVFVLPYSVPADGLDQWAENTGIIMLKKTGLLGKLYSFLGVSNMNVKEVYLNYLLPRFSCFPDNSKLAHILYIRDFLMPALNCDEYSRNELVSLLANIPFISINNQMKRVNQLYKADHPVFKVMLNEGCFLPEEYSTDEWMQFIKHLGLHIEVSDNEMVQFARDLARAGCNRITKRTRKKSKIVFQCLLKGQWEEATLDILRKIKFVVPKQITEKQKAVCMALDGGEHLVHTEGSVFIERSDLCWTSLNMMPSMPVFRKLTDISEALGILDEPPMSAVISHCQNICDKIGLELKKNVESNPIDIDFATNIFEKIYDYMDKQTDVNWRNVQRQLSTTPLILLPEEKMMLHAKRVVIELTEEDEIKPYLFRSPRDFGKYRHLFSKLGASPRTNCSVYVSVLTAIQEEYKGKIPPRKLEDVSKALTCINNALKKGNDYSLSEIDVLYLPNRQHCLVKSTHLTVSNNESLENRLSSDCSLDFFLGFQQLHIDVSDPVWPFEQLPTHIRPKILSTIVKEIVCAEGMVEIDSIAATRIERFLHSPDLIQGIIRLVKHQLLQLKCDIDETRENQIYSNLSNVVVRKVTGLKTSLSYNHQMINGSEKQKSCFIDETCLDGVKKFKMFFQTTVNEATDIVQEIMEEEDGLIDLVEKCTLGILEKSTYKYVPTVLRCVYQTSRIKQILDDKNITAYNSSYTVNTSAFPTPGTYVPDCFFPFLERSIAPFKEHEFRYVALDIGEYNELEETYEESYMYAHIVRELDRESHSETILGVRYEVDVGPRSEEYVAVYMHRLYKFMPQNTPVGDELVVYDSEPVGTVPFDENCNRIRQMLTEAWQMSERERRRVIHRLQLKWHQDKNIGNEEYATRVYNYMNFLIRQLELDVATSEVVDENTGREVPDMTGSAYEAMRDRIQNTGQVYIRRWREHFHAYTSPNRGGDFHHLSAETAVHPDVNEAKIWLRQAVNDYKMAEESLGAATRVRGFNWICYLCHQSCEKALKAAMYAKDANQAARRGHSLSAIVQGLDDQNLTVEIERLERELGHYFRMRYPDSIIGNEIPSDVFEKDKAELALKKTKQILTVIKELIE